MNTTKEINFIDSEVHPNPFFEEIVIHINLSKNAQVKVTSFNAEGKYNELLLDEYLLAGNYKYSFYTVDYPPGEYFIKIASRDYQKTIVVKKD